jgi:hypothetical protein
MSSSHLSTLARCRIAATVLAVSVAVLASVWAGTVPVPWLPSLRVGRPAVHEEEIRSREEERVAEERVEVGAGKIEAT